MHVSFMLHFTFSTVYFQAFERPDELHLHATKYVSFRVNCNFGWFQVLTFNAVDDKEYSSSASSVKPPVYTRTSLWFNLKLPPIVKLLFFSISFSLSLCLKMGNHCSHIETLCPSLSMVVHYTLNIQVQSSGKTTNTVGFCLHNPYNASLPNMDDHNSRINNDRPSHS